MGFLCSFQCKLQDFPFSNFTFCYEDAVNRHASDCIFLTHLSSCLWLQMMRCPLQEPGISDPVFHGVNKYFPYFIVTMSLGNKAFIVSYDSQNQSQDGLVCSFNPHGLSKTLLLFSCSSGSWCLSEMPAPPSPYDCHPAKNSS